MFMTPPEAAAMLQTLQPTIPLFNTLEGYQDIQSVVAVLEAQESFETANNQAHYKQPDGPLELPEEHERLRYLGFLLTQQLDWRRPLKIDLQFHSRYAYTPLVLMLRSFELKGKRRVSFHLGLTLHSEATVNIAGLARFEFEPLADWLKDPSRVTGFQVYLIRPAGPRQAPEPEYQEIPDEPGIVRAKDGLNVYRKIDIRA